MKSINAIFFEDNKYKEKIYSITNLRLLSFEIYKLFLLCIYLIVISKLSHLFFLNFFGSINFNFYAYIKIFIYLLIIDICYFIIFKSNKGIKSFFEMLTDSILHPDVIKLVSISLSFILIFFCAKEFKFLMPRLDYDFLRQKYHFETSNDDIDIDGYNENEYSDFFYIVCIASFLFIYIFYNLTKFDFWPKVNLSRINNLKKNICSSFSNIGIIGIPSFFVIYLLNVFFYRTLFVFDLSMNYTFLLILEYNIFFVNFNCLQNFICAPINYIATDVNSVEKLIKKEIKFLKEENFYIEHHLQHLRDLYEYPRDSKYNSNLLFYENLKYLQKKINFFFEAINKKYSYSYNKRNYFYISQNNNNKDFMDRIKIFFENIFSFFDFSVNQIIQKETCVQNIKLLIEIIGNVINFISDAKINKSNEEKYEECKDYSYYFVDKLIDIDSIVVNLIQNRRISSNLKKNMKKLRYIIKNYFELIRYKQTKNGFLKLTSQKLEKMLK